VTAPVLEPRRPGPGRLAGFVTLLGLVAGVLAVLSAAPWEATPAGAAALRVAFKHVAPLGSAPAAGPTAAEVAKLPRHMRPQGPAGVQRGARRDTLLRVTVDGRLVLARTLRPSGFRHDGPTFGYEELPLVPGRRRLEVLLKDGEPEPGASAEGIEGAGPWRLAEEVDVRPGQVVLVELIEGQGLVRR
jgi:hypothetical protein